MARKTIQLTEGQERRVMLRRKWNEAVLRGRDARQAAYAYQVEKRHIEAMIAASYEKERLAAMAGDPMDRSF